MTSHEEVTKAITMLEFLLVDETPSNGLIKETIDDGF